MFRARELCKQPVIWSSSVSHLLQTEDEGLGTLNLVCLSGFTQSLLDDVAIIVIILRAEKPNS